MTEKMCVRAREVKGGPAAPILDQPHRPEAAISGPADDDMIVECDPQLCRSVRDIPRDRDILPARFGAAARMVVDEDERRGAEFERAFDHFADIDGRLVDRTLAREFVAAQHVARVEVEDATAPTGRASGGEKG